MEDSIDMYDFGWDTPTNIYHYNETTSFIPKTYTVNINELRKAIIQEYKRATKSETTIQNNVDKEVSERKTSDKKIIKKVKKVETKVEVVEKKVETVEKKVKTVEKKVEKVEKEVVKVKESVSKEKIEREKADKELLKYFEAKMDEIELVNDSENTNRYYLQVGDKVKGDIILPDDASLQNVEFNPNTNIMSFQVGKGTEVSKTLTVDLSSLQDTYQAGYGLSLTDHVFSLNYNENNPFLFMNDKGQLDINIQIKSGNTGNYDEDIWSFYIVGKDGIVDPWTSSKVDLHPIKEYIDNQISGSSHVEELIQEEKDRAISAETAIKEELDELKEYIYQYMLTKENIKEGDNIVLTTDDSSNDIIINVRLKDGYDADGSIANNGLVDNLPQKGDTLNAVAEKLAKAIIVNADTIDGEEIDANGEIEIP